MIYNVRGLGRRVRRKQRMALIQKDFHYAVHLTNPKAACDAGVFYSNTKHVITVVAALS